MVEIETGIFVDLDLAEGLCARVYVRNVPALAPDFSVEPGEAQRWAAALVEADKQNHSFFGLVGDGVPVLGLIDQPVSGGWRQADGIEFIGPFGSVPGCRRRAALGEANCLAQARNGSRQMSALLSRG
ncbi:hypothetical protein [Acidocella aminolytica]|uniref:Inositol monophosphatase n=1 Tax=Acidocella aminolytica 101 = DSM 11237 TaxID=1120923 RepID=A0A0D6PF83_9PROT|nr:hypothetical protein [Acidocella aminolytica]GAN79519.1 inositol monophosphatase [Acidocella aminolytica 101 = DSM 11237]GBQ32629.1 hypothetical protein AA11237_0202 [Acidocella aminolytica 101 = DSM 11237]SHF34650.1 hypothetical protein SAMN02746095_02923 [Acidocella aminolytica 101 = DSM 11237]